ncbi:MAG: hypothetical protein V1875_02890 [Candidatus Altiarchaeota archaeon]
METAFDYTCAKAASRSGNKLIFETENDLGDRGGGFAAVVSKEKRRFPISVYPAIIIDIEANSTLPACFGIEDYPFVEGMDYPFLKVSSSSGVDEDTNAINAKARIQFIEGEIPAENFTWFKDLFNKISEKRSIILYPLDEDVSKAESDARAASEASKAPENIKDGWAQRIDDVKDNIKAGRCMKALKELKGIKGEVEAYTPPSEKKAQDKPPKEAIAAKEENPRKAVEPQDNSTTYAIAAAAIVVLALFSFFALKKKHRP